MDRRRFLKDSAAAAMLGCFPASLAGIARQSAAAGMERRSLGRSGEKLSILGFGGIVVRNADAREARARVEEAIEAGVNYFDVAPSYGDAEDMLGPALEPHRKGVFLACKTQQRRKAEATRELEQSLGKLRTDYFDLYQLHAVTTQQDVEQILGPDGALEAFLEARKAGKARLLGFSAHSVEAALALIEAFDFDTILFPVNYATWHAGNFGPRVLEKARGKGMGILALKAMAREPLPRGAERRYAKCWYRPMDEPADALMGLRFTLSHPVTAAIPPGDENLFKMALGLAPRITPLAQEEVQAIKERALKAEPLFRYPRSG